MSDLTVRVRVHNWCFECAKNVLGTDVTDAGILRSLRDIDHHAVVAVDQAAGGRSVLTTVQFDGAQTDFLFRSSQGQFHTGDPQPKSILDASGVLTNDVRQCDAGRGFRWSMSVRDKVSRRRPMDRTSR